MDCFKRLELLSVYHFLKFSDIDDCAPSPCPDNTTCVDGADSYVCVDSKSGPTIVGSSSNQQGQEIVFKIQTFSLFIASAA